MDRLFTVLPFLAAFFIAVAAMPTNVVQVNAKQMGTEHAQPWRAKALAGLGRSLTSLKSRCLALIEATCGHPLRGPALMGAMVLAMAIVAPEHVGYAMVGVMGSLKLHRSNVAAIEKELKDKKAERAALGNTALSEKREFTDDERKKFATDLPADIAKIEARLESAKEMLAAAEVANEAERNVPAAPADPDTTATTNANKGVQLGQDRKELDPSRGFKSAREFFKVVMDSSVRRKITDDRLKPLAAAGSDEQGSYNEATGGFLVPHGVAPGILQVKPEDDVLAGLITSVPMSAPTVSFNARVDKDHTSSVSGGLTVTRRPETIDGTGSRMKFEQVTLTANEEFGLAYASETILRDSPESFVAMLQAGFKDEYAAFAMNERINGTGTGERQGALSTGCKISIAKESGQSASTINKENIDKMAARCWRFSQAIWLANHNTRPQLKSIVQAVGTGGVPVPYFETAGAPAGFDGLLDGRPLKFTEFAKSLGTEGDLILLVPSEYLEGTYEDEQFAESIHVRFIANERAFRFYRRNDGQWWWRSALTPKNGSTLSPVVTLATRS